MPGRLFLTTSEEDIAARLGATLSAPGVAARGADISPGEEILALDQGGMLRPMRWGMILSGRGTKRRPIMETVINARSETVFKKAAFSGVSRALVPADGWYEWTGATRKKTRWRFSSTEGGVLMFAAIYSVWRQPGGIEVYQAATLTCEPNALVAPIHHRMGVLLPGDLWAAWMAGDDVAMDPAGEGVLKVEDASDLDRAG